MTSVADLFKEFDMAATDAIPSDLSFAVFDQEKGSHRKRCTLCDGEGCDECDKGYEKVTLGDVLKYSPDQARDDHGRWSAGSDTWVDTSQLKEVSKLAPDTTGWGKQGQLYDLTSADVNHADVLYERGDKYEGVERAVHEGGWARLAYSSGRFTTPGVDIQAKTPEDARYWANRLVQGANVRLGDRSQFNVTIDVGTHGYWSGNLHDWIAEGRPVVGKTGDRPAWGKTTLADLIKYSDYQPRDDHGRWTTGPNGEDYTGKGESLAHDRNPQLILKQQIELERVRQELPKAERARVKAGEAVYRRTGMSADDIETYKRMHGGNAPSPKADEALNNYQAARDHAESLERTANNLERDVDERTRPYFKGEMSPGTHVQLHDGRTGVIAMTASKDSGRIKLKDGVTLQVYRDDLKPHVSMQAAIDSAFNRYFEGVNSLYDTPIHSK